jgi:hypothetical protein
MAASQTEKSTQYNDRPQDSAPRQRSERPVFGTLIPKTFACLMHPAHTPCGGRVAPRSKIPEPATCITSLRCQTPAIAPLCEEPPRIAKISTEHSSLNPTGGDHHTTRSQPRTPKTPKKNGGARRDRTDDLKLAKLPLSQLSYGPPWRSQGVFDPLASSAGADLRPLRLSAPRGAAAIRPGGADAPKNGAGAEEQSRLNDAAAQTDRKVRKPDRAPALMRGEAKGTDVPAGV